MNTGNTRCSAVEKGGTPQSKQTTQIGGHLVAFYGNLEEEFKDFAKLIGFDVIEVDIKEIEKQIEELKASWPAHSVPNWMYERLEELEEALEKRKSSERKS